MQYCEKQIRHRNISRLSCRGWATDEKSLKVKCDEPIGFVYNTADKFEVVKITFDPISLGQPTK